MNDSTPAAGERIFDPAAHGWEIVDRMGFGALAGPLWRKGDDVFGFVAAEKHLNFNNVVHGGMISTLADQAMGMTALRANDDKRHATIELNVQFIGAVRLGEFVEAHCEVVRLTRAVIFMRAKVLVGPRTVATATGIWKVRGET